MRTTRALAVFSSLILVVSSCMLQSEEKNFVQINNAPDSKNQSEITYSHDGTSFYVLKDTVWLSDQVQFTVPGSAVDKVEVLVNGQLVIGGTGKWPLTVKRGDLSNDNYNLQIDQRVHTGTGSLSDKLGREYTVYRSNYVLVVESTNYTSVRSGVSVSGLRLITTFFKIGQLNSRMIARNA